MSVRDPGSLSRADGAYLEVGGERRRGEEEVDIWRSDCPCKKMTFGKDGQSKEVDF